MIETTNEDLRQAFEEHAKEDLRFQDNTRQFNGEMAIFKAETEGSLSSLHSKLDKLIETQLEMHERLSSIEQKVDIMWSLIQGLSFSGRAVKYLGSISVAIAAIAGTLFALVRFLK